MKKLGRFCFLLFLGGLQISATAVYGDTGSSRPSRSELAALVCPKWFSKGAVPSLAPLGANGVSLISVLLENQTRHSTDQVALGESQVCELRKAATSSRLSGVLDRAIELLATQRSGERDLLVSLKRELNQIDGRVDQYILNKYKLTTKAFGASPYAYDPWVETHTFDRIKSEKYMPEDLKKEAESLRSELPALKLAISSFREKLGLPKDKPELRDALDLFDNGEFGVAIRKWELPLQSIKRLRENPSPAIEVSFERLSSAKELLWEGSPLAFTQVLHLGSWALFLDQDGRPFLQSERGEVFSALCPGIQKTPSRKTREISGAFLTDQDMSDIQDEEKVAKTFMRFAQMEPFDLRNSFGQEQSKVLIEGLKKMFEYQPAILEKISRGVFDKSVLSALSEKWEGKGEYPVGFGYVKRYNPSTESLEFYPVLVETRLLAEDEGRDADSALYQVSDSSRVFHLPGGPVASLHEANFNEIIADQVDPPVSGSVTTFRNFAAHYANNYVGGMTDGLKEYFQQNFRTIEEDRGQ